VGGDLWQAMVRVLLARRELQRRREYRAATKIQSHFRAYVGRIECAAISLEVAEWKELAVVG
jgi:hypothetical protein